MARLEIHDAASGVTYAELSPDKPLLIGSGPNCDVVLRAPEVKRIHCRIVWRDGRWRIEVAQDAPGVILKDKTIKAGTVRPGDVIGIGPWRIYLDESPAAAEPAGESDAEPQPFSPLSIGSASALPIDLEPAEALQPALGPKHHARDQRGLLRRTWDQLRVRTHEHLAGEDAAPGEERLMSPLVMWLFGAVVVIVIAGFYFYNDYRTRTVHEQFDQAIATMNQGNWEEAIRLFGKFEEQYPNHQFASNARVQRALSEVEAASAVPKTALENARRMIDERSKEPAYPPIISKLGAAVHRIAVALAETAKKDADKSALEQALAARDLLRKSLPGADLTAEETQKLEAALTDAEAAIKKSDELEGTLEAMDQAIAGGRTLDAYQARERLIQLYADFETNEKLDERMEQARKVDREAVHFDSAAQNPAPDPAAGGLAASTLLLERKGPPDEPSAEGDVVFSLASGVCAAHDAATGRVLWHRPVGFDCHTLPLPLAGAAEPRVVLSDLENNQLVAVRARSGDVVWRQLIGEPFEAAPLVLEAGRYKGKLCQPTTRGSLVWIDAATGRIDGRLVMGSQRLATTPAADPAGQHLYQLGEQANLYVITLDSPPRCDAIFYLAHRPDSILAAPLRMNRYLVLCENITPATCRIRVLLLAANYASAEEIQRMAPMNGWVYHTPSVRGNLMFVASDTEAVEIFSAGAPEKAEGFAKVTSAAGPATPAPRGPAYSLAYTDRDLVVAGNKVRHYDLKLEQQKLSATGGNIDKVQGASAQPLEMRGKTIFVATRLPGSRAVLLTALDSGSFETRWEARLGAGVLSAAPVGTGDPELVAVARDGDVYRIPSTTLAAGGVIEQPAAHIQLGAGETAPYPAVVLANGSAVFAPGGESRQLYVWPAAGGGTPRPIDLPASLAGPVVPFGEAMLVPGGDGRIHWIAPETGKQLGEPFQPPLVAGQPLEWRGLAVTDKRIVIAADNAGRVYRIEARQEPQPHLAKRDDTTLAKAVRGGLATAGGIIACVDADNVLRVLDAETLAQTGEWPLAAPSTQPPVAAGAHIFVTAGTKELLCLDAQGQLAWKAPLDGETLAGPPLVRSDTVYLATRGGRVRALALASGEERGTVTMGQPLSDGVLALGELLIVPGSDTSLNVLKPPTASK